MIDFDKSDLFMKSDTNKDILITYDGGTITNSDLHQHTMSLEESLCSEDFLRFGSCEASVFKFTVHNAVAALKNQWLDVSMVLNSDTDNPLNIGKYKVFSDVPTADRKKRDIVAYDALYGIIHSDVSSWYNALLPDEESTVTLKEFRDSFFAYFDIEQEPITLVNDNITVEKTIQPQELSGKTVVNCICEINGCFGNIGRNGKFRYVYLTPIKEGLYPQETLYPSEKLYPEDPNTHLLRSGSYISANYEDYIVETITKLQIRQEEDDIGCIVGTGDNAYIIQDNFLVYGKSTDELKQIADRILEKITGIYYRPFNAKAKGNPCLEVGDGISLATKYVAIHSYILQRTLTGVKSLKDSYSARGNQYQASEVNSIHNAIVQLKGKSNKLTRTIEETRLEMKDMEKGLESTISVTAEQIRTELKNTKEGLESSITQTATQIRSEVSDTKNGLQSQITQNADSITSEIKRATTAETSLSTKITQTDEKIRTDVAKTYETKDVVEQKALAAENNAKADTTEKLKSYSTTVQMNSAIEQKADSITTSVNKKITETVEYVDTKSATAESNANANTANLLKSYSTTTQMNSAITQKADSITTAVNKKIEETKEYAETKASAAETNAKADTTEKLKSYSTTTEMNSAIEQSANSINLSVDTKITETKKYADTQAATAEKNAKDSTDTKLKSYTTTTEMNAAIKTAVDGIDLSVYKTVKSYNEDIAKYSTTEQMNSAIKLAVDGIDLSVYYTKTDVDGKVKDLEGSIKVNADNIALKVSASGVVNAINISEESIKLSGNRLVVNSTNFKLDKNGNAEFSGKITGGLISLETEKGDIKEVMKTNVYDYTDDVTLTINQADEFKNIELSGPVYIIGGTVSRSFLGANTLDCSDLNAYNIYVGSEETDGYIYCNGNVQCTTINGYRVINAGNISSYLPEISFTVHNAGGYGSYYYSTDSIYATGDNKSIPSIQWVKDYVNSRLSS